MNEQEEIPEFIRGPFRQKNFQDTEKNRIKNLTKDRLEQMFFLNNRNSSNKTIVSHYNEIKHVRVENLLSFKKDSNFSMANQGANIFRAKTDSCMSAELPFKDDETHADTESEEMFNFTIKKSSNIVKNRKNLAHNRFINLPKLHTENFPKKSSLGNQKYNAKTENAVTNLGSMSERNKQAKLFMHKGPITQKCNTERMNNPTDLSSNFNSEKFDFFGEQANKHLLNKKNIENFEENSYNRINYSNTNSTDLFKKNILSENKKSDMLEFHSESLLSKREFFERNKQQIKNHINSSLLNEDNFLVSRQRKLKPQSLREDIYIHLDEESAEFSKRSFKQNISLFENPVQIKSGMDLTIKSFNKAKTSRKIHSKGSLIRRSFPNISYKPQSIKYQGNDPPRGYVICSKAHNEFYRKKIKKVIYRYGRSNSEDPKKLMAGLRFDTELLKADTLSLRYEELDEDKLEEAWQPIQNFPEYIMDQLPKHYFLWLRDNNLDNESLKLESIRNSFVLSAQNLCSPVAATTRNQPMKSRFSFHNDLMKSSMKDFEEHIIKKNTVPEEEISPKEPTEISEELSDESLSKISEDSITSAFKDSPQILKKKRKTRGNQATPGNSQFFKINKQKSMKTQMNELAFKLPTSNRDPFSLKPAYNGKDSYVSYWMTCIDSQLKVDNLGEHNQMIGYYSLLQIKPVPQNQETCMKNYEMDEDEFGLYKDRYVMHEKMAKDVQRSYPKLINHKKGEKDSHLIKKCVDEHYYTQQELFDEQHELILTATDQIVAAKKKEILNQMSKSMLEGIISPNKLKKNGLVDSKLKTIKESE